jgi:hypothetical protein
LVAYFGYIRDSGITSEMAERKISAEGDEL